MKVEKGFLVEELEKSVLEDIKRPFEHSWDQRRYGVDPLAAVGAIIILGSMLFGMQTNLPNIVLLLISFIHALLIFGCLYLLIMYDLKSASKRKKKYVDRKFSKIKEENYPKHLTKYAYLDFILLCMLREGKKFDLNKYSDRFKNQKDYLQFVLFGLKTKRKWSYSNDDFEVVELFLDENLSNEFLAEIFNSIFVFKLPTSLVKSFLDQGYSIEEIRKEQLKFKPIVEKKNETKIEENDKNENEEIDFEENVLELVCKHHSEEIMKDKGVKTPLESSKVSLDYYKKVKSPKEMEKFIKILRQDVDLKWYVENGKGFKYLEESKLRDIGKMNESNVLKLIQFTGDTYYFDKWVLDLFKEK